MFGPLGHVGEANDLVPHGHHGDLHPDHPSDSPRSPRTARVHNPLRLEGAPYGLDGVKGALLTDAGHFAHLEEVHRITTEYRTRGIAGRHRRVDVTVVRGVRRPHKAVPVQVGEPSPARLRLDPLVLDASPPPHLDQPQVTFLLLLGLGDDVVARLRKAGVQAQLVPQLQIQIAGELAQPRRRLRTALLADHTGRTARRPTPAPTPPHDRALRTWRGKTHPGGPEPASHPGCILESPFKIDYTEANGLGQPACRRAAGWRQDVEKRVTDGSEGECLWCP